MTTKALIKKYKRDYNKILNLYMQDKLYLTQSQLNKFIKLRGEKKYPHYVIKKGRQVITW